MVFSLRLAVMMVYVPVAIGIGLWRPFWGLVMLMAMYYFRPSIWGQPTWWAPVEWITIAVIIGWLLRERNFRFSLHAALGILLLLAMVLSSLFAVDSPDLSFDATVTVMKLVVYLVLFLNLVRTAKEVNAFLWMNVIGMLWNVKTVLVIGFFGGGLTSDTRVDVPVGQGGGANYLAMIFVMGLPLFYFKFLNGTRRERLLSLLFTPAWLLCVVVTGSRGGFLALVIVALYLVLLSNRKVLGFLTIVAIMGFFLAVVPEEKLQRFTSTLTAAAGRGGDSEAAGEDLGFAAESRVLLWKAGLQMFREYPIAGIGHDNFQWVSPQYTGFYLGDTPQPYQPGVRLPGFVAHSTWVQTLAEGGLIAAVPFFSMFLAAFVLLRRIRALPLPPESRRRALVQSRIIEGALLAFVVCSTFGSHIKIDPLWWYFGVIGALYGMVRLESGAFVREQRASARLVRASRRPAALPAAES